MEKYMAAAGTSPTASCTSFMAPSDVEIFSKSRTKKYRDGCITYCMSGLGLAKNMSVGETESV